MTRGTIWAVGLAAVVIACPPAQAAQLTLSQKAESPYYGEKWIGMLARGALNVTTGFVDLLARTMNESKSGPPVAGTVRGLALGTGCGVLRTGSGVIDLVTFWVPGFNGAPVSSSYANCLSTEEFSAH